ncbi:Tn3 family transposase, partial [Enterobacter hormaechei]|uniref:Tn3 family transposase n=1 Tax=Enterobacter hormaechei TaxID=158836 RepID=UPI00106BA194
MRQKAASSLTLQQCPRELRKLVGGKAREDLIVANWPDIFRCAATMTAGKIRPSQLL